MPQISKKKSLVCEWKREDEYDADYWTTTCGDAYCVIEGTLKDNNIRYCPFCGKKIKEITT